MGVPSLVSRGSHCADALAGAGAAVVADPDEASLAEGLHRLLMSDRAALSEAARAFARKNLDWHACATAFVDGVRAALE